MDPGSGYAVANGDGIFELTAPAATRTSYLASVQEDSSDVRLSFTTDQVATGGGIYTTVSGRRVSSSDDYRLNVRLGNVNNVVVSIGALKGATSVTLSPGVTVPGTYEPGSDIHVRLQVQGTNPTRIQAKAWLGGAPEPETWTVSATDSHAALQAPGSVGFATYLSGSATISPVNVRLHKIAATR